MAGNANPSGFTDRLRAICARNCADCGDPPCWKLPELVDPCERITPCGECLAEAEGQDFTSDDLHLEPIVNVEVAALLCTCGACDHGILIEYEALDQESGKIDAAHDFDECPECGTNFDAQAACFGAHLQAKDEPDGR